MRKTRSLYKDDISFDLLRKSRKEDSAYMMKLHYLNFNTFQELKDSKISKEYLSDLVNNLKDSLNLEDSNIFSDNKKEEEKSDLLKNKMNKMNNLELRNLNCNKFNSSGNIKNLNKSLNLNINLGIGSNLNNNDLTHRSDKGFKRHTINRLSIDNNIFRKFYFSNNPSDILNNHVFKNKSKEVDKSKSSNEETYNEKQTLESNNLNQRSSLRRNESNKSNLYKKNFMKKTSFRSPIITKKSVKFDVPVINKPKRLSLEERLSKQNFLEPRKTQSNKNFAQVLFNNNDFDIENMKFKKTQLTNRNIVELNEIKSDLKKSLVLNKKEKFKLSELDAKSFLYDHDDSFESTKEKDSQNEYEKKTKLDKERNYRELQRKGIVYDSLDDNNDFEEDISILFIHPESFFLTILDFIVLICIIYNLIYIPLFLGYNDIYCVIGNNISIFTIIDLFIDFIYLIDLVLHFFIAFYNKDDMLKTELPLIVTNYLKGWFIVDLMSLIPFKTLLNFFDTKCNDINFLSSYKYSNQLYYLLICMKLFKTLKIYDNRFCEFMDEHLDKYVHYNNYFGFYLGTSIFFFTIHVVTCILIFIGKNDYPSWIIKFGFSEYSFSQLYFLGIYYIITTVTTVGYGDLTCVTPKEKIFGIIIEIVGIVAYSYILTSISNYVKSINDAEEEYFKKYKILEDIKLNYKDLSEDLFDRINRYIKNKQTNEDQEKNLIEELPITLRNTLVYSMYEPIILNFVFFKNFDNKDFIVKVLFCFKPILAIKNDILIKDGDFVEDIIFVKKGKISIELPVLLNPNQEVTSNLIGYNTINANTRSLTTQSRRFDRFLNNFLQDKEDSNDEEEEIEYQNVKLLDIRRNEHFGDVLMLSNERSPLTAIVKSRKAELFYLNKKDAIDISHDFPQIWSKIQKNSYFNMQQIKKLMSKVMKLFYKAKGIYKKNENSISSCSEEDISDQESEYPKTDNNSQSMENNDDKKNIKKIQNLKTIKEATNFEDSAISNTLSKIDKSTITNNNLDFTVENDVESIFDSDSSHFNKKYSIRDDCTIKMENISNRNIDFSNICSGSETYKKTINETKNSTPFKPFEINDEIYPNEIQSFINFKINESPKNNFDYENLNNIKKKFSKSKSLDKYNNNLNLSICSTEISFSISSKYENIDELSDYKYSKTPVLRKKIKYILKSFENESEYVFNKYKTNKNILKKTNISIDSFNKNKNNTKKNIVFEINKKKKKIQHSQKKSSDNVITYASLKKNPNFNFLEMINDNIEKNLNVTEDDLPNFTQIFQNFIDKEKSINNKELEYEKEELNKKLQRIRTIKSQHKSFKNNYKYDDTI